MTRCFLETDKMWIDYRALKEIALPANTDGPSNFKGRSKTNIIFTSQLYLHLSSGSYNQIRHRNTFLTQLY